MKRLFLLLLLLGTSLFAQTTLYVGGPKTGLFSEWRGITYTASPDSTVFQSDALGDRQTGQTQDDFVNTANNPGLFMSLGMIDGVTSIGFRVYLAGYSASGYSGNLRIGIDANEDGALDIFAGPKLSGAVRTQGIVFQDATGPGNYSPSTTALSNPYGRIAFTTSNYNYKALDGTLDSTWTNVGVDQNSVLSFAIPTQTLKDNLAAAGIIITDQTYFTILAFTSTQANAINQDLYGSTGINKDAPFGGLDGGFGDYYALDGSYKKRPVTPEPATYGAIFMIVTLGITVWARRKQ